MTIIPIKNILYIIMSNEIFSHYLMSIRTVCCCCCIFVCILLSWQFTPPYTNEQQNVWIRHYQIAHDPLKCLELGFWGVVSFKDTNKFIHIDFNGLVVLSQYIFRNGCDSFLYVHVRFRMTKESNCFGKVDVAALWFLSVRGTGCKSWEYGICICFC